MIANPVYDRTRQFRFAVAGDFDLSFDGKNEDRGGAQVARLIERLGGEIVSQVDTTTDFVVLGSPPPAAPAASLIGGDDAAIERAEQLARQTKTFETFMSEARALSIPVLTRTQFLHFVGYGLSAETPDDPAAM